ncbi:MAG: glutathione S-transferase family protein [Pseudomonadota bacterium]
MSEIIFYTNPQSRGRIAHWMLEEIGHPYETVWLEFGKEMKDTNYLAVNPMGKVPTIIHGDVVVTEAAAICVYLADQFPEKNLAPPNHPASRAAYYRWMFFAAGPLESALTAKAVGWEVPEGKSSAVGFGSYADTVNALATALCPGPYICGEQFTAADVYVGASLNWGMAFGNLEKCALFEAYVGRLNARPAAQNANRLNEEYLRARQPS